MTKLIIRGVGVDDGGLVVITITGVPNNLERIDEFHIDAAVVNGIIRSTVNGRDIEDGLAPIEILASIISEKMGINDRELPWPDPFPDWLDSEGLEGELLQASREETIEIYELTPLVVLLAKLAMFGGEEPHAVTLDY